MVVVSTGKQKSNDIYQKQPIKIRQLSKWKWCDYNSNKLCKNKEKNKTRNLNKKPTSIVTQRENIL